MKNLLHRLLLLSSIFFTSLTCQAQDFQPFGNFGGHTYYLSTAPDNWIQSHLKALNAGLILTHISSSAENTFIHGTVTQVAWIGLGTGLNFNGNNADLSNYRWSDSVGDAFTNFGVIFGAQQPDNANGTQRCIVLNSANCLPAGSWDDTEPGKEFLSVAEGPLCAADVTLSDANIVLGCGTSQSATLIASTGIFFPTYAWTGSGAGNLNSLTNDTVVFTPTQAGTFTVCVTVSNPNSGCTTQVCKNINVTDIFDTDEHGKKDKTKVVICHVPPSHDFTKVIPISALGGHLGHGDYCGPCRDAQARMINVEENEIKVYPNPTSNVFYVDVPETAVVRLLDIQGRVLETQNVDRSAQFNLGNSPTGMYFIEVNYAGERFRTRIVRQ